MKNVMSCAYRLLQRRFAFPRLGFKPTSPYGPTSSASPVVGQRQVRSPSRSDRGLPLARERYVDGEQKK
jgi:hypothetical protein